MTTATPTESSSMSPADEWRSAGSRALHPSTRTDKTPDSLFLTIATGLAEVAVPAELQQPITAPRFDRLLDTPSYWAWLGVLPVQRSITVYSVYGAVAIVSGDIEIIDALPDSAPHLLAAGTSLLVGSPTIETCAATHGLRLRNAGTCAANFVLVSSPIWNFDES